MPETYYDPKNLAKFPEIGKEASERAMKFFDSYSAVFDQGGFIFIRFVRGFGLRLTGRTGEWWETVDS